MHMAQHFGADVGGPSADCVRVSVRPYAARTTPARSFAGSAALSFGLRSRTAFREALFPVCRFAWLAMNLTYVGWHIPKAYEFALSRKTGTTSSILLFLRRALSFGGPIVQPWPARRRLNFWMIIPYLLTSDFVNTGLSASYAFQDGCLPELCSWSNGPSESTR